MTIAETLAERIASVRYDALPEDAVHWARVAILDTVGCTLAGASEPCARIVGARDRVERPVPGVRHRSARGTAGCGADQRHRVACAGLRRLQQHAGRASVGADPAGAVRAGRDARGRWAGVRRRLCGGMGDRDAHRARHQLPSLREGLASDSDDRRVRRDGGVLPSAGSGAGCHRNGAGAGGVVRVGREGEFRHDDEAAACRALLAQRAAGRAAGGGRVHRQRRRAGAQAGVPARVQRRRQFRRGGDPARLGSAVGHRAARRGDQAVSVLRQHASGGRRDAVAGARAWADAGDGGAREFVDASAAAGAHQPARPAKRTRCQVQRAVLPGARAAGSPRVAGAFRGRQFPRSGDPRAAAAHPCGAASRDVDGEHRAFRRRGAGDADGWAGAVGEGGAAAWARAGRTRCPTELLEAKFLNCATRALPMEAAERLLAVLRRGGAMQRDMRARHDRRWCRAAALAAD